jgi:hypothetical protein
MRERKSQGGRGKGRGREKGKKNRNDEEEVREKERSYWKRNIKGKEGGGDEKVPELEFLKSLWGLDTEEE